MVGYQLEDEPNLYIWLFHQTSSRKWLFGVTQLKRNIIFQTTIVEFHVNFPVGTCSICDGIQSIQKKNGKLSSPKISE